MRKLISIEDMANLINSTLDVQDRAIITILAKTGIRRRELITLDVDNID
jgi:integrase/recombinase XerD